jgi:hypothetical protein
MEHREPSHAPGILNTKPSPASARSAPAACRPASAVSKADFADEFVHFPIGRVDVATVDFLTEQKFTLHGELGRR